jgi:hypothetical protein
MTVQDYLVLGLCPKSSVPNRMQCLKKYMFPLSGEEVRHELDPPPEKALTHAFI